MRGPDDSAKIGESFFIDLVIFEELRVVAKISKKPIEFPESSFRAVQPPRQGPGFERFRFQNNKADLYEWLLRMPSVVCLFHSNKEQSFQIVFDSTLIQMQARNLPPHS